MRNYHTQLQERQHGFRIVICQGRRCFQHNVASDD